MAKKGCDSCKKRQQEASSAKVTKAEVKSSTWLKNLFTFKKAMELSQEDMIKFEVFLSLNKEVSTEEEYDFIEDLYRRSFNLSFDKMCRDCPKVWSKIVKDLTTLYEGQKQIK